MLGIKRIVEKPVKKRPVVMVLDFYDACEPIRRRRAKPIPYASIRVPWNSREPTEAELLEDGEKYALEVIRECGNTSTEDNSKYVLPSMRPPYYHADGTRIPHYTCIVANVRNFEEYAAVRKRIREAKKKRPVPLVPLTRKLNSKNTLRYQDWKAYPNIPEGFSCFEEYAWWLKYTPEGRYFFRTVYRGNKSNKLPDKELSNGSIKNNKNQVKVVAPRHGEARYSPRPPKSVIIKKPLKSVVGRPRKPRKKKYPSDNPFPYTFSIRPRRKIRRRKKPRRVFYRRSRSARQLTLQGATHDRYGFLVNRRKTPTMFFSDDPSDPMKLTTCDFNEYFSGFPPTFEDAVDLLEAQAQYIESILEADAIDIELAEWKCHLPFDWWLFKEPIFDNLVLDFEDFFENFHLEYRIVDSHQEVWENFRSFEWKHLHTVLTSWNGGLTKDQIDFMCHIIDEVNTDRIVDSLENLCRNQSFDISKFLHRSRDIWWKNEKSGLQFFRISFFLHSFVFHHDIEFDRAYWRGPASVERTVKWIGDQGYWIFLNPDYDMRTGLLRNQVEETLPSSEVVVVDNTPKVTDGPAQPVRRKRGRPGKFPNGSWVDYDALNVFIAKHWDIILEGNANDPDPMDLPAEPIKYSYDDTSWFHSHFVKIYTGHSEQVLNTNVSDLEADGTTNND